MGLFGKRKKTFDEAFAPYSGVMPGDQPEIEIPPMPGQNPGFWNGGGKFGGRDALAGLLAAVGDAFANQAGMQGGAVENLAGGRLSAIAMAKKQAMQAQEMEAARQRAIAAGVDPARADMMARGDPNPSEWMPKQEEPAPLVRDTRAFQNMTPEERAQYAQLEAIRNPRYMTDAAGMSHQLNNPQPPERLPPDFFNGGPTQPASGGFRGPPRYRR